jgi:hypothetical protein
VGNPFPKNKKEVKDYDKRRPKNMLRMSYSNHLEKGPLGFPPPRNQDQNLPYTCDGMSKLWGDLSPAGNSRRSLDCSGKMLSAAEASKAGAPDLGKYTVFIS